MADDNNTNSITGNIQQLNNQLEEVIQLMLSQHDMLKQRGMTLPSGSIDNLTLLKSRLGSLQNLVVNAMIELQRLRALAETTALINSTLAVDSVLEQVMDTVVGLTGAERGYIVLKDRETGEFDQFRVARGIDHDALSGYGGGDEPNVKRQALIVSRTVVNEVARTGEAVLTDNASQDERYRSQQSIVGFALRSILAVPLKVRDEVIGVVYCDNRILAGLFQASDLETLKAFSNQAAVAIENARLFEEAHRRLEHITEMRDLMDNVFDSIANGVITVNVEGVITACNAAALNLLHAPAGFDASGHLLVEVIPELNLTFHEAVGKVRADGKQRLFELRPMIQGLGKRHWSVIISSLIDAAGYPQGIAIVIDDLTEQKQREAQLQELRRYLPGALIDNFQSMDEVNLQGEERVITVIATDVRGFTSFSERLEPEQLMEVINHYLSLASDGINLYEGIVDKYMGDAVTGLFNTQLNPQEDHAIRAVRAALSVIYDLYALHEIMPDDQRLYYGIGIHTGPAYLGNVGSPDRQEFSALGEAVSVAKLLEANAKPGEIMISAATYEQVKGYFECEMHPVEKTGGRYPLEVMYKVTGRKKGTQTTQLFLDPELAELLAEDDTE